MKAIIKFKRDRNIISEKIHCRVPLRISFAGGGTDLPFYFEKNGGAVIGSSIDKFSYSTLSPKKIKKNKIEVRSIDFNLSDIFEIKAKFYDLKYDGKLDLAKAVINVMNPTELGFEVITDCDVPPGSGLASSTSMIISLVGVLKSHMGISLSSNEIALLSHKIERGELSIKGGLQDQFACTFGGFYFLEFKKDDVKVNLLKIKNETIQELESNLVLVDIRVSRESSKIHSIQAKHHNEKTFEILDKMKKQAYKMKSLLLKGNTKDFAEELHQSWITKKKVSEIISTARIDKIYEEARSCGSVGGKILGAGGGGHMLLYIDLEKRKKLEKTLKKLNCDIVPFCFEDRGIQTWKVDKNGVRPG